MNKKIYIIFSVILGFVLNIFFYIFSDNYRYFLQSLKRDKYNINDNYNINLENIVKEDEKKDKDESIFSGLKQDFIKVNNKKEKQKNKKIQNIKKLNSKNNIKESSKVEFLEKSPELKLTNIEKDILKKLKKYNLKQVKLHSRLFGLTSEYPDKYFEYYNKDLTLYFFGDKPYSELKDIFKVLTYELPISINEVNNFGQKSFYINLKDIFDDSYVRLVIQKSNRTFGIKIKKDLYNKIKNDLYQIFKK